MGARQQYDWEAIHADYEAGESMGKLSEKYGVDKSLISRNARKGGWLQDVSGVVDRKVNAKVNGIVHTVDPKKRAAAIDAAAEKKAAVIERHRQEWSQHQRIVDEAVKNEDLGKAKLAKITAETIQIRQAGERKAWGIIDVDVRPRDETATPRLNLILSNAAPVNE